MVKKRTTLVGGIDKGGGSACEGAEDIWEISTPSAQFCGKTKTDLNYKAYLKMNGMLVYEIFPIIISLFSIVVTNDIYIVNLDNKQDL